MDVLAKEAGVARATVYEHFRSKRAVLDELASSTSRSLALENPDTNIGDPLTALRDMLGAVCRHWHEHEDAVRELRRLAAVTGADAPTDAVDHEYLRWLVDGLVARVTCGRAGRPPTRSTRSRCSRRTRPTNSSAARPGRTPAQIEALLAKLAVSIVSPSAFMRLRPRPSSTRVRSDHGPDAAGTCADHDRLVNDPGGRLHEIGAADADRLELPVERSHALDQGDERGARRRAVKARRPPARPDAPPRSWRSAWS